jgi:hypothetical protein
MGQTLYCACGEPLHYTDWRQRTAVERQIAELGPDVSVRVSNRSWIVPRHYLALHNVRASELAKLRFPEIRDTGFLCPYLYDDDDGGMLLNTTVIDYRNQLFSHIDPDDHRIRHFDISKLIKMIKQEPSAFEIGLFELLEQQVNFIQQNHGIDETHFNRISDEFLNEPGIICLFADTSQLVVDGNHRFIARARRNLESMAFWLVPETTWRKALLRLPSQFDAI